MLKRTRKLGRETKYTGVAAMLAPLNVQIPSDSDEEEVNVPATTSISKDSVSTASGQVPSTSFTELQGFTRQTTSRFSSNHQPREQTDTTKRHVNALIEQMEGHSSLTSYHHPHPPPQLTQQQHHFQHLQHSQQHHNDVRASPIASHPYYQQQPHPYSQPNTSNGEQSMTQQYDFNQASTSSDQSSTIHRSLDQDRQYQADSNRNPVQRPPPPQYEPSQQPLSSMHSVRYEHLPQSAPPHQRTHVLQYPVKVLDPASYAPSRNNIGSQSNISSIPLSKSSNTSQSSTAPPPSAPPVMAPRKTPPFQKRHADAQEQQRVDFEVARNVSQIMSKNGLRVTQEHSMATVTAPPPPRPLAPLTPLPPHRLTVYQCPNCNRNLANARNLQRHRQSCGTTTIISSSPIPQQSLLTHQQPPAPLSTQEGSPQLAALLRSEQKPSPPEPSSSAPPAQLTSRSSSTSSGPPSSTFQHHNSAGNLTLGYSRNSDSMYSPQHIIGDPNVMLCDGYDYKDETLFPGPHCEWSRDDSFHSEPASASHDHLDMMDPLGFHDPLLQDHHPDPFHDPLADDQIRDSLRDLRSLEDSDQKDSLEVDNIEENSTNLGPIDLEMHTSLDSEEPLLRSQSASLSSSSQERTTPAPSFVCHSCQKSVGSDRSLRRHYNTCKAYQAELLSIPIEERVPPTSSKRKPAATTKPRAPKKLKEPTPDPLVLQEKNRAIRAVLNKEPSKSISPLNHPNQLNHPHQYHLYNAPTATLSRPPAGPNQFQAPYGTLPSINSSWLQPSNERSEMFTPPMASQQQTPQLTPNPQKSSPLEMLLNDDDVTDDGDSRSSSGTVKPSGNPAYACGHCSKQLCSASNLKRHRATCKIAQSSSTSVSNPSSQPSTPAPAQASVQTSAPIQVTQPVTAPTPQPAPPQSSVQVFHPPAQAPNLQAPPQSQNSVQPVSLETTATVTYTKTLPHVTVNKNWNADKMMSPTKQKTAIDSDGKAYATVGEVLRAQHNQQRPHHPEQQSQLMFQPRYQTQPVTRIPPRPPNPILNQVQNPPQQVQQNQIQNQISQSQMNQAQAQSRQPVSLVNQNPQQQQPQRLQSPPRSLTTASSNKKGLIEHRNTDLVLITSEPLAEKRPGAQLQDMLDPKRRASEPHVTPLPPIQLPPRNREPQTPQQPSAFQVQFTARPLPPMQLPPLQSSMQHQNQGHQNQNHQNHHFGTRGTHQNQVQNRFGAPIQNQMTPSNQSMGLGHPQQQQQGSQMHQGLGHQNMIQSNNSQDFLNQNSRHTMHTTSEHGFGHPQGGLGHHQNPQNSSGFSSHSQHPQSFHRQNQMNQNLQGHQNQMGHQVTSQSSSGTQPQNQNVPLVQQNQTPMVSPGHQSFQIPPTFQNQTSYAQNNASELVSTASRSEQGLGQMSSSQNVSHPLTHQNSVQQHDHREEQNQMTTPPLVSQTPLQASPGKRSRSQSNVGKKDQSQPETNDDQVNPQHRPGSPLDSIITSVPLSVEVHHHAMKQGKSSNLGQCSIDSQSTADPSPEIDEKESNSNSSSKKLIPYLCPECDKRYSCRKNVKRHRQAVHKLTMEEILAKPEKPAPPEPMSAPVNHGGRRHTVAGVEDMAVTKGAGNKRKASVAVTSSGALKGKAEKKGKELTTSVELESKDDSGNVQHQEQPTQIETTGATGSLPQVHTILNQRHNLDQKPSYPVQFQDKFGSSINPPAQEERLFGALVSPGMQHSASSYTSTSSHSLWNNTAPFAPVPLNNGPESVRTEDDAHKMQQIAAELKRCAEKTSFPTNNEGKDDDQILFEQLRLDFNGKEHQVAIEDTGDILGSDTIEADSTSHEDMQNEKTISTSSSVGIPSLSSPEERFIQQQKQQQQYTTAVWNDELSHATAPMPLAPDLFQEPVAEPSKKRGARAPPKRSLDHICTGCKKVLGTDYSLRRHRTGCAEVQKVLNPEYPKPPPAKRKRQTKEQTREQAVVEAEREVERIEALPPPLVVYEVVDQFNAERKMLSKAKTAALSTTTEGSSETLVSLSTLSFSPSNSTSKSSSMSPSQGTPSSARTISPTASTSSASIRGGPKPTKNQARYMCQGCNKLLCSEWSLTRHQKNSCPQSRVQLTSFDPTCQADSVEIVFTGGYNLLCKNISRSFLASTSPLFSVWLTNENRAKIELDSTLEDFLLLLNVHSYKTDITADNIEMVAAQSQKYELNEVLGRVKQFRFDMAALP